MYAPQEMLGFYLEPRLAHFYTQNFALRASGYHTAIVIRKNDNGLIF